METLALRRWGGSGGIDEVSMGGRVSTWCRARWSFWSVRGLKLQSKAYTGTGCGEGPSHALNSVEFGIRPHEGGESDLS